MNEPIRLLIADDHPIVRHGLCLCLAQRETIQIVGQAGDGHEALTRTRELKPDVVLMDIDMPQLNGLVVTDLLQREMPQVKVLLFSSFANVESLRRLTRCGACGLVLKEASPEEIARAIETVQGGAAYFSPAIGQLGQDHCNTARLSSLTNREREILTHIAEGGSNKSIADRLNIGVRTVETHRESIMRKLGIHSIAGLTRFALAQGMVSLTPPPQPEFHAAA